MPAADENAVYALTLNPVQVNALKDALSLAVAVGTGDAGPVLAIYGSHAAPRERVEEARHFAGYAMELLLRATESSTHEVPDLSALSGKLSALDATHGGTLTFDKEECNALIAATETGLRLHLRQVHPIIDAFRHRRWTMPVNFVETAEAALHRMHTLLTGFPPHASHGISHPDVGDTARVLYDIHQILRHQAATERDMGGWHVWKNEPCRTSTDSELPVLSILSCGIERGPGPL